MGRGAKIFLIAGALALCVFGLISYLIISGVAGSASAFLNL